MQGVHLHIFVLAIIFDAVVVYFVLLFIFGMNRVEALSGCEPHSPEVHAFCKKFNNLAASKLVCDTALVLVFFTYGYYFLAAFYLPAVLWLGMNFLTIPHYFMGIYDTTAMYNPRQLRLYLMEAYTFLIYHIICYFVFTTYMALLILTPIEIYVNL